MLNVSPSTVSHVIHGRHHKMKPETLERVRQALYDTNYVPNMGGRLLGNHGSRIIGVIMTYSSRSEQNVGIDPFYGEIIGALEQEIRIAGYFMMLYTSADVQESLRMAISWDVEGIIVLGSHADDCARFMQRTDKPLVFIDSYFHDDGLPYVNIGLEDRQGGYLMTRHLLKQGHRRIAFLADSKQPVGVDHERLSGFKDALAEYDIRFRQNSHFIHIEHKTGVRYNFLDSFKQKLLSRTALFFASDFYAVAAINVFHDMGLRVPEDISVCGFDDNIFSLLCRPKLTTVKQDVSQKATHAVANLVKLIHHEPMENRDVRLGVSLVIRDSVRPIREAPEKGRTGQKKSEKFVDNPQKE